MENRGILMHISSLPSPYGIGNLGKEAYNFIDFLELSNQKFWQILPQNPTGFGDSPYQSSSAFAGNPYFIDIDALIEEGLLLQSEADNYFFGANPESVDYEKMFFYRFPLLRCAFFRFKPNILYEDFVSENSYWLEDYALFMALKEQNHYQSWQTWDESLKNRDKDALAECRTNLKHIIDFYKFIQFKFFEQWHKLKNYACKKGIKIIGDMPIYISADSADIWANRELFEIDENNNPKRVACQPPHPLFKEGQLWGNPLYNWDKMKENDYEWWARRFSLAEEMYDIIRIDHFYGFFEYYSTHPSERTAKNFSTHQGPGEDFFNKLNLRNNIIAENLGIHSPAAERAINKYGFFGMHILQNSVDFKNQSASLPANDAAYTGNHDNNTILGWYEGLSENKRRIVRKIFNIKKHDNISKLFIDAVLKTNAPLKIIPIQDYLNYPEAKRMNTPSTIGGNWLFRVKKDALCSDLAEYIKSF